MSSRIQRYLDKARECERMAAKAKSREAAFLANDARQWRELAKQAEHWEHVRGSMTESNSNKHDYRPLRWVIKLDRVAGRMLAPLDRPVWAGVICAWRTQGRHISTR
jgi:hypothetical protein